MNKRKWSKLVMLAAASGMALFAAFDGFAAPGAPPEPGKMFIERMDVDGDGKVSKAEYLDEFTEMDADSDGYISESEAPKGPPPPPRGMSGNFIEDFDKDGDGMVSSAEFPGPAEHFSELDADGDGYIEASEAPEAPEAPDASEE